MNGNGSIITPDMEFMAAHAQAQQAANELRNQHFYETIFAACYGTAIGIWIGKAKSDSEYQMGLPAIAAQAEQAAVAAMAQYGIAIKFNRPAAE